MILYCFIINYNNYIILYLSLHKPEFKNIYFTCNPFKQLMKLAKPS